MTAAELVDELEYLNQLIRQTEKSTVWEYGTQQDREHASTVLADIKKRKTDAIDSYQKWYYGPDFKRKKVKVCLADGSVAMCFFVVGLYNSIGVWDEENAVKYRLNEIPDRRMKWPSVLVREQWAKDFIKAQKLSLKEKNIVAYCEPCTQYKLDMKKVAILSGMVTPEMYDLF